MFLPVLLLRDFGVWGYVVFAIPNVIGAAAMGWVVTDRERASRLLEGHLTACGVFSAVTICFQIFFAFWLLRSGVEDWSSWGIPWLLMVMLGAGVAATLLLAIRGTPSLGAGAAVWLLSIGAAVSLASRGALHAGLGSTPQLPVAALAWLAPVCIFGFMLCPYLDATFIRTCREAPNARAAFTIGFGVFFLSMVVFTLMYARVLLPMAGSESEWAGMPYADLVRVHVLVQLLFTIVAHALCWQRAGEREPGKPVVRGNRFGIPTAIVVVAFGAQFVPPMAGLSGLEVAYRCFMAFYGLVFPAYVWICMVPTRDGHSGTLGTRGRRKLRVLAAAIAMALPCYWMGFIERETWWLAPGLGIVLLARVVVMGKRKLEPGEAGEDVVRGGV
jgi:hypothetical protein